jgi:hypothetical protein
MTLGVLTLANPRFAQEELRIKTLFLMEGDACYSIGPNKRLHVDVLIIPDSEGLNCTTSAFYPHHKVPAHYPGQDQWAELFRLMSADWYVKKRIPIVGIGTGALLLYDILGGKIQFVNNELEPIRSDNFDFPDSHWGFAKDIYVGLPDIPDDMDFYRKVSKLARNRAEYTAQVLVPQGDSPLTLKAGNENVPHEIIPIPE